MALTPTYIRQQTIPQTSGQQMAPLSLASNGVAEAAGGVSDVLSAAASRIQRREDIIATSRIADKFKNEELRFFSDFQKTGDLLETRPGKGGVDQYRAEQLQRVEAAINSFDGTNDARAGLRSELSSQSGVYFRDMLTLANSAQDQYTGNLVSQNIDTALIAFEGNPEKIDDAFLAIEDELIAKDFGLSSTRKNQIRKEKREAAVVSAFESYFVSDNLEKASIFIESKKFRENASPEIYKKAKSQLIQRSKEMRSIEVNAEGEIRRAEIISGMPRDQFTQEQRNKMAGIAIADSKPTIEQKVSEYKARTGRAPDPAIVQSWIEGKESKQSALLKTQDALGRNLDPQEMAVFNATYDRDHTGTEDERMFNYLVDNAPLFKNGQMQGADRERFVAMAQEYQNTQTIIGRDANDRPVIFAKPLPPVVQNALNMQNVQLSLPSDITPKPDPFKVEMPGVEPENTIFGVYQSAVGLKEGLQSAAVSVPFFGENVPPESLRARTTITNANAELVRALQQSPRFSEGERQAIAREFALEPGTFMTDKSFLTKMVAINESVQRRLRNVHSTLADPNVGKDDARDAKRQIRALENYSNVLNLPPVVGGPDEVRRLGLEDGAKFIDRNTMKVYTVRTQAKQ
jgi:hypothetical protein